ncbi:hypothetical protein, partial [Bradyrhizobium sp. NBAIM20]|uniref:hypothetical protein n=1 Tax=Bradyrhizobium sp. NBAIM20 TaxID=2793811 RepID=UPI001CD2B720
QWRRKVRRHCGDPVRYQLRCAEIGSSFFLIPEPRFHQPACGTLPRAAEMKSEPRTYLRNEVIE